MQRLLEHRAPFPGGNTSASARRQHLTALLGIMAVVGYIAFFVLPRLAISDEDFHAITSLPPPDEEINRLKGILPTVDANGHRNSIIQEIPELAPWGYNADRNVPRWKAIYRSIASDAFSHDPTHPLSVIDHGADQGYFAVSMAKFFPHATVIGLELGGAGGMIWVKGKQLAKTDVLRDQEGHLDRNQLSNVIICQTRMHQRHFFALRAARSVVDYQLMLSVFHWFDLKTRDAFEEAVAALFATARTTFIELPIVGDKSKLIRDQVGYENFVKWYDGRDDIGQILMDAAKNQRIQVRVQKILSSKWVKWTRDVFRVDYFGPVGSDDLAIPASFQCEKRLEVYGCNMTRKRFLSCPADG
jgi:hypothetical protein